MESHFVAWNAENGSEPENYVGALYGLGGDRRRRYVFDVSAARSTLQLINRSVRSRPARRER